VIDSFWTRKTRGSSYWRTNLEARQLEWAKSDLSKDSSRQLDLPLRNLTSTSLSSSLLLNWDCRQSEWFAVSKRTLCKTISVTAWCWCIQVPKVWKKPSDRLNACSYRGTTSYSEEQGFKGTLTIWTLERCSKDKRKTSLRNFCRMSKSI